MQRILVTGRAGFIGSHLVRGVLSCIRDAHVVTLDALTFAGSLDNLADLPDPSRHTFVRGGICDQSLVVDLLRRHAIDTIATFGAGTHVHRSIKGGAPFIRDPLQAAPGICFSLGST